MTQLTPVDAGEAVLPNQVGTIQNEFVDNATEKCKLVVYIEVNLTYTNVAKRCVFQFLPKSCKHQVQLSFIIGQFLLVKMSSLQVSQLLTHTMLW